MRIATFNMQNLRLRRRNGRKVLDGAVDGDVDGASGRDPALDAADRRRAAMVIHAARADVLALQEVFDRATLDHFHDAFLRPAGVPAFDTRICLPGNDGRGLNVAALCRPAPLAIHSHATLTAGDLGLGGALPGPGGQPLFRRDCLRLDFARVSLFVCHFKAPYPDVERARAVRRAEAMAVRRLVEAAFPDPASARWIVLGDFNEPLPETEPDCALLPLLGGFTTDLLDRLPPDTDWTFATPDTHRPSRPDRILVSPRVAAEYPDLRPVILRAGFDSTLAPTAPDRPHASDHALVYADFPGF